MIYTLVIEVDVESFQKLDQGKMLSYRGQICLYGLCLNDMHVFVFDLLEDILTTSKCRACLPHYSSNIKRGKVTVYAVATNETKLSSRLKLTPGNYLRVHVDKNTQSVIGEFYYYIAVNVLTSANPSVIHLMQ